MNSTSRLVQWLVWGGLGVVIAGILGAFVWKEWIHPGARLPVYAQLGDFALTNQFARPVGLSHLRGKVWLADVIFTRCPGPCAKMTAQMRQIQSQFAENDQVQFVSFTADPEFDTPEVLKSYAARLGADGANWQFLTGPKKQLYDFAANELKFTVIDNDSSGAQSLEDRFLHSTQFVLVDSKARIRGYFDGEKPGASDEVAKAIQRVLREKN